MQERHHFAFQRSANNGHIAAHRKCTGKCSDQIRGSKVSSISTMVSRYICGYIQLSLSNCGIGQMRFKLFHHFVLSLFVVPLLSVFFRVIDAEGAHLAEERGLVDPEFLGRREAIAVVVPQGGVKGLRIQRLAGFA